MTRGEWKVLEAEDVGAESAIETLIEPFVLILGSKREKSSARDEAVCAKEGKGRSSHPGRFERVSGWACELLAFFRKAIDILGNEWRRTKQEDCVAQEKTSLRRSASNTQLRIRSSPNPRHVRCSCGHL